MHFSALCASGLWPPGGGEGEWRFLTEATLQLPLGPAGPSPLRVWQLFPAGTEYGWSFLQLPMALPPCSCGDGDKVCGLPARLESTRDPLHPPPLFFPRLSTHLSREEGPEGGGHPLWADKGASSLAWL